MAEPTRVITIDDDSLIRMLVASVLETMECAVVGTGEDGDEAEDLYQAQKPDLVLLDMKMPKVNGFDALRSILAIAPDAHVVMLSGMSDTTVAESCIEAGAKDFIQKDTGPEALRANLERVVQTVQATKE